MAKVVQYLLVMAVLSTTFYYDKVSYVPTAVYHNRFSVSLGRLSVFWMDLGSVALYWRHHVADSLLGYH